MTYNPIDPLIPQQNPSLSNQGAFRFWVQTVLPTIYDDSLSYYELLNKVVQVLNAAISDVDALHDYVQDSIPAQNTKINETVSKVNGLGEQFDTLKGYVDNYFANLDVQDEINNKLNAMAADGTLTTLIEGILGSSTAINQAVADWLEDYAETSGITAPAIDPTLAISEAAADAKRTGDTVFAVDRLFNNELKYHNYLKATITNGNLIPEGQSQGNRVRIRFKFDHTNIAEISCSNSNYVIRDIYYFEKNQTTGGVRSSLLYLNTNASVNKFYITKNPEKTDVWVLLSKLDATSVFSVEEVSEAVGAISCYGDYENTNDVYNILRTMFKGDTAITPTSMFIIGNLSISGTVTTAASADHSRIRTQALRRGTTAPLFAFTLNSDDYYIDRCFSYPSESSTDNAKVIKVTGETKKEHYIFSPTIENYYWYRFTFGKYNVADDYEMTSEDKAAIQAAFRIVKMVDSSLSLQGVPADGYTTGNAITNNNIAVANVVNKLYNSDVQLSHAFVRGHINEVTGAVMESDEDEYTAYYSSILEDRVVSFDNDNISYRLFYYNGSPSTSTYSSIYTNYVNGTEKTYINSINADRVILQVYSETALTDDDILDLTEHLSIKEYVEEGSTQAIEQVKNNRPNQGIITQLKSVCNDWLTNAPTANLTYGGNGILNTSSATNQIDCSTFVGLVLRGYPYTLTSYATGNYGSILQWTGNPLYDWSINPYDYYEYNRTTDTTKSRVRSTSQLAQWFVKRGEKVLVDEKLANIEVGDIIFFSRINEDTGDYVSPSYYMKINHCAIVVSKERMTSSASWDASKYPFKHMIMDVGHENNFYYDTNRKVIRQYPLALRPLEAPQHLTTTELTPEDEASIYTNNINTMVLVCRPDFGSLSV